MNSAGSLYNRVVLDHPIAVLAILAVLLLGSSFYTTEFRLDASADSLLLEDDQDLRIFRELSERYHENSALYLAFTPHGELFGSHALQVIQRLKKDIELLKGVDSVSSVLDLPLLKQSDLSLAELVTGFRTLQSEGVDRASARKELRSSPVFNDLVVSADGTTTALRINLANDEVFEELSRTKYELRYRKQQAGLTDSELEDLELVLEEHVAYTATCPPCWPFRLGGS